MRHLLHSTAVVLALALGLSAGPAIAQTSNDADDNKCFDHTHSMDWDGDGLVTQREMMTTDTRKFGRMDLNKDGTVSASELEECNVSASDRRDPHVRNRNDQAFKGIDKNQDGFLTRSEYMQYAGARYTTASKKSGGSVKADQYSKVVGAQSYDSASADADGDGKISDREAAADVDRSFGVLDYDRDDQLSADEWKGSARRAGAARLFKIMDTDGDQMLSKEEYLQARQRMSGAFEGDSDEPISIWWFRIQE